jgi:hypothetical protein
VYVAKSSSIPVKRKKRGKENTHVFLCMPETSLNRHTVIASVMKPAEQTTQARFILLIDPADQGLE